MHCYFQGVILIPLERIFRGVKGFLGVLKTPFEGLKNFGKQILRVYNLLTPILGLK
jgi:hypothetical protein